MLSPTTKESREALLNLTGGQHITASRYAEFHAQLSRATPCFLQLKHVAPPRSRARVDAGTEATERGTRVRIDSLSTKLAFPPEWSPKRLVRDSWFQYVLSKTRPNGVLDFVMDCRLALKSVLEV